MLFGRRGKELDFLELLDKMVADGVIKHFEAILFCTAHTITPVILSLWEEQGGKASKEDITRRYAQISGLELDKTRELVNKWVDNLEKVKLITEDKGGAIKDKGLKLVYDSLEAVMIKVHEILLRGGE